MKKARLLLSRKMNTKLSPGGIVVFNLPVGLSCGRKCPGCYALKAERHKVVRLKRLWNMKKAKQAGFVDDFKAEITTGHCKREDIVRFHEAGDFFSQDYVDKVTQIVKETPNKSFYAYTKRMKDFAFSDLKAQKNMILFDSEQFGPVNYFPADVIKAMAKQTKAFVCPATDKISCNHGCTYCTDVTNKKKVEKRGIIFKLH